MADFKDAVAKSPVVVEIREAERTKGRVEGQLLAVRKLWIKRFGKDAMATDVEVALSQSSSDLLEQIIENFGDVNYTLLQARNDIKA